MRSNPEEMVVWSAEQTTELTKEEALESLLANPSITISKEGADTYYYSSTQIHEAYKIGAQVSKKKRTKNAVYRVIRDMNIGDCLFFPIEKHGAVRTAASKLKSAFFVQYITGITMQHGEKEVRITRIK